MCNPISVEDELPKDYKTVIVQGGCAFYDAGREKWYTLMEGRPAREIIWYVTHWMPMPEFPTGRKVKNES